MYAAGTRSVARRSITFMTASISVSSSRASRNGSSVSSGRWSVWSSRYAASSNAFDEPWPNDKPAWVKRDTAKRSRSRTVVKGSAIDETPESGNKLFEHAAIYILQRLDERDVDVLVDLVDGAGRRPELAPLVAGAPDA